LNGVAEKVTGAMIEAKFVGKMFSGASTFPTKGAPVLNLKRSASPPSISRVM